LRIAAVFTIGLTICTALAPLVPLGRAQAQAQTRAAAKKPAAPARDARKAEQERSAFSLEDEQVAAIPGIPDARAWGDSEADFARLLPPASGPWLAISGGGSGGAFGGGVVTGWTESGSRPEFTVVTGVSIGALIAPFAFLGPRYDEQIRKNFSTVTAADIFEDRVLSESLFDDWPLRHQIEQQVTPKLLQEIAAEHARGRRLFVATTNLDAARRVVWNMGAIAARGDDKAVKLFRDVLLASSSIPGFFSPVAIEAEANGKKIHELHGDGTITAPFFVAPESVFAAGSSTRLPISQLFVIVNSKLVPEFSMVDRTIAGVLGRSIAVALTAALRSEIMLTLAGAQRKGIPLRVAYVDPSFSFPYRGSFDGKYMKALYEFAVTAAKQGTAFEDAAPALSMRGTSSAQ
jgi:Patatin-like phospholipase